MASAGLGEQAIAEYTARQPSPSADAPPSARQQKIEFLCGLFCATIGPVLLFILILLALLILIPKYGSKVAGPSDVVQQSVARYDLA
jgi:hypothetical protein